MLEKYRGREEDEEEVSSYRMSIRERKDTGSLKTRY
jgi:hypothetical protein